MNRHQGPQTGPARSRAVLLGTAAIGAIVGMIVLSSCGPGPTAQSNSSEDPAATARLVDPAEFASAVAEPGRVTVNVHVPFEGDIAGTDLSIPFDRITAQADRLPADRGTALAIYCRSGPMSAIAAQALHDLGYRDVVELRGGMRAWQADGRPLTMIRDDTSGPDDPDN